MDLNGENGGVPKDPTQRLQVFPRKVRRKDCSILYVGADKSIYCQLLLNWLAPNSRKTVHKWTSYGRSKGPWYIMCCSWSRYLLPIFFWIFFIRLELFYWQSIISHLKKNDCVYLTNSPNAIWDKFMLRAYLCPFSGMLIWVMGCATITP